MCGRFTLTLTWAELSDLMRVTPARDLPLPKRYNVAPTQTVPVVRRANDGSREIVALRWGLIPSWAKDASIGARLINARGETVATKPAFRSAFRTRRCLVPISGFYEWERAGTRRQPWYIRPSAAPAFAVAGLWERWSPADGAALETFTIVTTAANELIAPLHERMPAILAPAHHDRWLDPAEKDARFLESLLAPFPGTEMEIYRVSTLVNRATVDEPACVEPLPG